MNIRLPSMPIILVSIALLAALGVSYWLTPRQLSPLVADGLDLETLIPQRIGNWEVDDQFFIVPAAKTETIADEIYDQTLARAYSNGLGDIIMLVIAFGADQGDATQLHRPEVCYTANGFEVSNIQPTLLDLGTELAGPLPALQLETTDKIRFEPVTYWMRVGNALPSSTLERQGAKLAYGLSGYIPDGVLVRVSSISREPEAAFELHKEFIGELIRATPVEYRSFLVGSLAPTVAPET